MTLKIEELNQIFAEKGMTGISYRQIQILKYPDGTRLPLVGITEMVEAETLEEINRLWRERDMIDLARETAIPVGKIPLSDKYLAKVVRWHIWGLDINIAIRKIRSEIVHFSWMAQKSVQVVPTGTTPSKVPAPIPKKKKPRPVLKGKNHETDNSRNHAA